jgi:hypothetical protein
MDSPVDLINNIDEFTEMQDDFKDDDLDKALGYIVLLIHQPEIMPQQAPKAIVKLQALSAKFAVLATYYTSIDPGKPGTENNKKKNVYYTLAKETDKLAAAIKYLAKPY